MCSPARRTGRRRILTRRAWYAACAAYGNDPASVELELLGEGQVCLHVSEKYLAFAQEEEITDFIDFGWMKNAFILDYLADTLAEHNFTNAVLSSYDGFVRNLDERDTVLGFNIFDRMPEGVLPAAVMQYAGRRCFVSLRDYPVGSQDDRRYYEMEDGRVLTAYLDPADGLAKCAVQGLTAYSDTLSCGELALRMAPVYVAESLDETALTALAEEGIFTLRCKDDAVLYTDPDAILSDFYDKDGVTYTSRYAG